MTIVLEEGDPMQHLPDLGALFARNKNTHAVGTRRAIFEWYYDETANGASTSWLLRERSSGDLVGLCSVVPRQLRLGNYWEQSLLSRPHQLSLSHQTVQLLQIGRFEERCNF